MWVHLKGPFTSSDCDVTATSLPNLINYFGVALLHLVTATLLWCCWGITLWAIRERRRRGVAVAGCKWALRVYPHRAKAKVKVVSLLLSLLVWVPWFGSIQPFLISLSFDVGRPWDVVYLHQRFVDLLLLLFFNRKSSTGSRQFKNGLRTIVIVISFLIHGKKRMTVQSSSSCFGFRVLVCGFWVPDFL